MLMKLLKRILALCLVKTVRQESLTETSEQRISKAASKTPPAQTGASRRQMCSRSLEVLTGQPHGSVDFTLEKLSIRPTRPVSLMMVLALLATVMTVPLKSGDLGF